MSTISPILKKKEIEGIAEPNESCKTEKYNNIFKVHFTGQAPQYIRSDTGNSKLEDIVIEYYTSLNIIQKLNNRQKNFF